MRKGFGSASKVVLLIVLAFGLSASRGSCAEGDARPSLRGLQAMVDQLKVMMADVKDSVCMLYQLHDKEAPDFCPPIDDVCDLPIEVGPCLGVFPRWGFDGEECVEFNYGGCGGNANNFADADECAARCDSVCNLPADPGPCDAVIPRWFHNPESGRCEKFIWGGCGGNGNNYKTFDECAEACDPVESVCELPNDPGPCLAYIPRWFFNEETGVCERFIWGGCGGNDNNFGSLSECQRSCLSEDLCSLPADPGPCRGAFARWFHNPDTGECERFIWGGCLGNPNNFDTLAECERACPACDDSLCPEGEECKLQDVVCFTEPCPPVVTCVPPCEGQCLDHQECRTEEVCIDNFCEEVDFCADTCDGFECPVGTQCRLQEVVCVRPPCPPVAVCAQ